MSSSSSETASQKRRQRTVISSLVLGLAALLLLRVLVVPDPGGHLLYARAQRLEATGLVQPALRQYLLLARSYPKSDLAPQALWNAAELQTDLARAGDFSLYDAARKTYTQLADTYFNSQLAPEALLRAGELAVDPLHDYVGARISFERVLREYSETRDEEAARATLGLGRVAQGLAQRDAAKRWYERVLERYPQFRELDAQAQYRLGETYETLFKDHPLWARAAYEKTIKDYPQSAWASQAKERLGLLLYAAPPRERRVLVEAKMLPEAAQSDAAQSESGADASLLAALRMALRARGIEASQTLMEGLTLAPFFAGYAADNPSRAVRVPLDEFENAVANAGLLYETEDGSDAVQAARSLQREVDAGHATLIFTGRWQFVAGYDSSRGEVMLQDGARLRTLSLAQLSKVWKRRAPGGGSFTLIAFHTPGEVAKSRILPPGSANVFTMKKAVAPNATTPNAAAKSGGAGALSSGKPSAAGTAVAQNANAQNANAQNANAQNAAASTRGAAKRRETSATPQSFSPQLLPLSAPTYVVTLAPLDERAMHKRIARAAANAMRRARSGDAYLNLEALQSLSDALQAAATQSASTREALPAEIPDFPATPQATEPPVRQQNEPLPDATLEPTRFQGEYAPHFSPKIARAVASRRSAFSRHASTRANTSSPRFAAFSRYASTRGALSSHFDTKFSRTTPLHFKSSARRFPNASQRASTRGIAPFQLASLHFARRPRTTFSTLLAAPFSQRTSYRRGALAARRASTRAAFALRLAALPHRLPTSRGLASSHSAFSPYASTRGALFVAQIEVAPTAQITPSTAATPRGAATPEVPPLSPPDAPQVPRIIVPFSQRAARERTLSNWRGAAASRWIVSRRSAAAYLDFAASRTGDSSLQSAAALFRESARNLESAALALGNVSGDASRDAFSQAARFVNQARAAEARATQMMSKAAA